MKIVTIKGKRYGWHYKRAIIAVVVIASIAAGAFAFAGQEPADQAKVYEPEDSIVVQDLFPVPVIADVPLDAELQEFIWNVSEDYGLDPLLVLAVIGQESNYKLDAVSEDGLCLGLMQVQKGCHEDRMDRLGAVNLLDPYDNVIVGIDYLSECIERGGLKWGLMAYNGGPEYADAKTTQGITTEYVESILYLYESMGGGL